jgi:hypothetical protein
MKPTNGIAVTEPARMMNNCTKSVEMQSTHVPVFMDIQITMWVQRRPRVWHPLWGFSLRETKSTFYNLEVKEDREN